MSWEDGPHIVFYELTRACDLACWHCRACAVAHPDPHELSPDLARRLVDQLTELDRPPLLVLTGGDPLKRGDIFDLVRHAVRRGIHVAVTPSATPLVTREALARLHAAGISRLAVSLDAASADAHDAIRGFSGSFLRTLRILQDARDLGIPLQVNTTVMRGNRDQLPRLAELLAAFDVTLWSVFFLVPTGRGATLQELTANEYEEVFACLWHEAQRRPFPIKTTEAPHYRRFVRQQIAERKKTTTPRNARPTPAAAQLPLLSSMNDGKGILFVGHTGAIHPSGFLPIVCGTFPDDSLVEVYRHNPVFRALRDADRLQGKCGACEFRQLCGGSRARAYALTGDWLAEEPRCAYRPTATRRPNSQAACN